jgi:NAD+ diphosphatase
VVVSVPALSRTAVDRVSSRRDDIEWLEQARRTGRLLVIDSEGRVAVDDDGPDLIFVDAASWSGAGEPLLLGVDGDDRAYWGVVGDPPSGSGTRRAGLREVGAALGDRDAGLFVTLVALSNWHATHTHCPRCGAPTEPIQAGWSTRCTADGSQHFPRTDPAVIVLLHDGGDRALLGRQPSWPRGRYSTIAGFVESGESGEQAVHREVGEETGVVVEDVVYRASQPWPFPASLMLGYEARVVGFTPAATDDELEDVHWFSRTEVRQATGLLPPPSSIAHWLIAGWLGRG